MAPTEPDVRFQIGYITGMRPIKVITLRAGFRFSTLGSTARARSLNGSSSKVAFSCVIFCGEEITVPSPTSPTPDHERPPGARTMTRLPQGRSPASLLAAAAIVPVVLAACEGSDPVLARGEAIFDTCAPCHGPQGAGKPSLGAPAIAGASEWYLRAQLDAFRTQRRGYHYQDAEGLRMRPMSRTLKSEKGDVDAIVAYVAGLPAADPPATRGGDAEVGEEEYATLCANCHGRDGRGMEALSAPSLLHLSDWYIASSLKKYRERIRGGSLGDAAGATMYAPVSTISDERIDDVTAYIMTMQMLPRRPSTAGAPALAAVAPPDFDPAILPEGVTPDMVEAGLSVFHETGICYTCHTQGGQGGPLGPDLTDDVWLNIDGEYESIVELVNTGVPQPVEYPGAMLPTAGMPLTDDQVRAVAAYVYVLSR